MTDLKPGREFDVIIAEKVMGLKVITRPKKYLEVQEQGGDFFGKQFVTTVLCHNETFNEHHPGRTIKIIPAYSTDIAAAWEVVEKMRENGYEFALSTTFLSNVQKMGVDGPWASFGMKSTPITFVEGDHFPHAICLAALKAVEEKK